MDLNFNEIGGVYVAEFKVDGDFNLHIETDGNSAVELHQTSVEGTAYDKVQMLNRRYSDTVIDTAVTVPIPPMWIKVTSTTKPAVAIVTSMGEVVEGGIVTTLNTPV